MNGDSKLLVPPSAVWYAIIYDLKRRKIDYLDGFNSREQAERWLLTTLNEGQYGEADIGNTLHPTGNAPYYKNGEHLLTTRELAEKAA
jgi:hypothetical protein